MADRHVVVVVVALDADIIEGSISIVADGILILLFVVVVLLVVRKVDVVVGRVNASAVDGRDVADVSSIINAAVATPPPTLIVVVNIVIPFDTQLNDIGRL